MALKSIKTLAAATTLAFASLASAGTSNFTMVNGLTAPGIDVTLTIQASSTPGYAYDFVVTNHSTTGIVTGFYLEEDWTRMLQGAGTSAGPATLYPASLNPMISEWEGPMVSRTVGKVRVRTWVSPRQGYVDNYYDDINAGIHPGQTQVFSFVTDTNIISLQDMEDAVADAGFNVGIRMQGLSSTTPYAPGWGLAEPMFRTEEIRDPQQNNPITAVPSPTAAFAGLTMLGLAAARRRRA